MDDHVTMEPMVRGSGCGLCGEDRLICHTETKHSDNNGTDTISDKIIAITC